MASAPRPVIIAANSSWNIVNFRSGLIRGLKQAGYSPVVVAPQDAFTGNITNDLGVEHVPLAVERSGLNPIADLRLLARYRSILERVQPVAFLGFTIKPNIYGSLAAASLGVPAIPNVSGLGTAFIRGGALKLLVSKLYQRAFREAPVVFFQNPEDRSLFVARGIAHESQARMLPGSGIDPEHFSPAPQPEGAPKFLLIGRLLGDKGLREFVEAARLTRGRLPEVRYQLLGPIDEGNRTGIRRSELEGWVAEGSVEYLGVTEDVRPYVAAASVIVLPSYREGLPRTLLEGAAMARPLVATDVPGCREVVEDGVNGFLCAVRDARSLAEALTKVAQLGPEGREAMGRESRRKVQERFSEDVVIGSYLKELARLEEN